VTPLELVKRFEGCRLKAYQDVRGVWTVGWGCTGSDIDAGTAWTQEQADTELEKRVAYVQHVVEAMLDVPINDNQKAALVSFAYNLGLHAFERSSLRKKLNAGDIEGAAAEFGKWSYAAGRVVPGLFSRRMAERKLFLEDETTEVA
jgi:lysozyme